MFDYITGRLGEASRREIGKHLERCTKCRWELQRMEEVLDFLELVRPPELPSDFAERVMERLEKEGAWEAKGEGEEGPGRRWWKAFLFRPVPVLAVILLCLV
jgi:anti-sigma factor RsiW